jgi:hypothetical protein
MTLKCRLFSGDRQLEAAAVSNPAHILKGAVGDHVRKIQKALLAIDNADIERSEISAKTFGASTEKAVLQYKTRRRIINTAYQRVPDAIVGIMTMASLDKEMIKIEAQQDELTALSALATALGYTPAQKIVVTNQTPLRSTVDILKTNIAKR